jgi:hypothetical protein
LADERAAADPTAQQDDKSTAEPQRRPMYDQDVKMLALLERVQADARANHAKMARDRADLLALRMERGGEDNQWLVWDGSSNTYITRPSDGDAGLPQWFFRATSNHLGTTVDGIAAILNQSEPAKNWYHTRDDDQSRAAAEVAEMADPVLLEELGYPRNLRPRINKLITLTNLAALVVNFDTDPKYGTEAIPVLQCQDCGALVDPMDAPGQEDTCPECGGALDFAVYPPKHPQYGQPVTKSYPRGKMHGELLSSFEVSIPRAVGTALEDEIPWVASHQRWSVEEAISRWAPLRPILQPDSRNSGASSGRSTSQAYADQMRALAAPITPGSQQGVSAQTANGPVIWRLWHDPIDDDDFYFPDGLFLTVMEGEDLVLESGPLPYVDDEGRPFKNILTRQFAHSAGSQWGKPPADDLVPLQKQLNLAQSLAFLILMHHASPRTFIPSTVTLFDKLSNMPGKDVYYRGLQPGDKPSVEPGVGFPEALKWFLEFIITTFEKVSKLNAVLMGERPTGDPTLGEVQILQERGFAAFQAPLEQLVNFERRLSLKLMWIARESVWAPRFARLLGENGNWKLQQFSGAQLEGHYTLDIELSSAWPKSPLLTNLRVQKAIELQILNPMDPEVVEEYLRVNDLQAFKGSVDEHVTHVARQLDVWKQATDPRQIEPPQPFWKLDLHLFRKSLYLVSEEFEQQKADYPAVAAAMIAHVQQLQMMLQPQAAPPEAQPGDKGTLGKAVAAGALKPKGSPGGKGALPTAVKAGALQPAGTAAAQGKHNRKHAGPSVGDLVRTGVITPKAPTANGPTTGGVSPA